MKDLGRGEEAEGSIEEREGTGEGVEGGLPENCVREGLEK